MNRLSVILLLGAVLLGASGCHGGAVAPATWTATPPDPTIHDPARDQEPRVQVFIHYDRLRSTHAALRVTSAHDPPVFWDPGGAYGLTKPHYGRSNDIILHAPPTLPKWWEYRARWMREPFLLVFEWDVEPAHADAMRHALLDGAKYGRRAALFRTLRAPGLCGLAVCDFLREHASPPLSPHLGAFFVPDSLAQRLWTQSPSRVLRYEGRYDATPMVLLPPPPPSEAETATGLANSPEVRDPALTQQSTPTPTP